MPTTPTTPRTSSPASPETAAPEKAEPEKAAPDPAEGTGPQDAPPAPRVEWHDVSEKRRLYGYPGGETLVIERPLRVGVSASGNHYIDGGGVPGVEYGDKWIVAPGWRWIRLEGLEGWDF